MEWLKFKQHILFAATKENQTREIKMNVHRGYNNNRHAKSKRNKVAAKHEIISRRADKGQLLGVRGLPGGPGTLGVPLGAPGDPYKRRRVVTGEEGTMNPAKESMLSALTESERILVCWIRILS